MKKGIIGFLVESNKMIDLKITDSFPLLAIGKDTTLVDKNLTEIVCKDFQHFSIPADLQIHLTKEDKKTNSKDYIFFTHDQIISELDTHGHAHLFTYISNRYSNCSPLKGSFYGAALISPSIDEYFLEEKSRLWIDFIVHRGDLKMEIDNMPLSIPNMRLASDRHGHVIGPFLFEGIQRKSVVHISDLVFSIRMGFYETTSNVDNIIYVPYNLKMKSNSTKNEVNPESKK